MKHLHLVVKVFPERDLSAMPFDPRAVANRLLDLGRERQLIIDPMKVQKLIYYAHGWHLALTGKPLLDRSVEAWQYGPVLPDVYRAFQDFGSQPITEPARYAAVDGNKLVLRRYKLPAHDPDAEYADRVLRRILEEYGNYSAIELSMMTHAQGTPWAQAWSENQGKRYIPISDEEIEAWFKSVLKPVAA
ncbi:MAG TPA: type II toxin-antitoxin system antitoxin SocA domain-containing protein [Acidobacteriaceae bacterium]